MMMIKYMHDHYIDDDDVCVKTKNLASFVYTINSS